MKKSLALLSLIIVAFSSCQNEPKNERKQLPKLQVWKVAPAGTQVAVYSKPIAEDKLNKQHFEVKIFTTDSTAATGTFLLEINYEKNQNQVVKKFPKWYENNVVQPMIKPIDSLQYGVLVGFDPGDGQFNDIYKITVENKNITMRQTKMYGTTY